MTLTPSLTGWFSRTIPPLRLLGRWLLLAVVVGLLAGAASALFLIVLEAVTHFREDHPALIIGLPLAGGLVGWIYLRFGGRASGGTSVVLDAVHDADTGHEGRIPLRMAPFVLVGTWLSHLFGASVGREGTAIQMGAALADGVRRALRLGREDRRLLVLAGISGGFGAVFGTPAAGAVFALEVHSAGRIRYDALIPSLTAAVIGDWAALTLGATHTAQPALADLPLELPRLLLVIGAGIAFGLAARLFVVIGETVRHGLRQRVAYPPLRPVVGGLTVIALTLIVGTTAYNGLSLPLINASVRVDPSVAPFDWLAKLVFTGISVGSGFIGGEVTPLFGIGASLGHAIGMVFGDPALLAAIGFAAVFGAASNTPIACTLLAVEVFGGGSVVYVLVGIVTAYYVSGGRQLYPAQRIDTPKYTPYAPS